MVAYLEDEGYETVARNWVGAGAEVDIIVRRGGVVRFVEVKARRHNDDSGLESIGLSKQHRLRRAATAWLVHNAVDEIAFMVALVTLDPRGWQLELIDDAF